MTERPMPTYITIYRLFIQKHEQNKIVILPGKILVHDPLNLISYNLVSVPKYSGPTYFLFLIFSVVQPFVDGIDTESLTYSKPKRIYKGGFSWDLR